MIRKPIAYKLAHYIQAERPLRRWDLIALSALRLAFFLALIFLWLAGGNWIMERDLRRFPGVVIHRSTADRMAEYIPYLIWIPVMIWSWHAARVARRKAWLEQVEAAGIEEAEFGAAGVSLFSPTARYFFRWDAFSKIVERPGIYVLFLNRSRASIVPKIDFTPEDAAQIAAWQRNFSPRGSLLELPPEPADSLTLSLQLDYRDYREAVRLERRARTKLSLIIRRWVALGIVLVSLTALILLATVGSRHSPRNAHWYWMTFATPAFIVAILLYSAWFAWLARWRNWREVRQSVVRSKLLRLTDTGLDIRSAVDAHHLAWRTCIDLEVGKRIVLLRLLGGGSIPIPLRQAPMGETRFVTYLQDRIVNPTQAFPVLGPAS